MNSISSNLKLETSSYEHACVGGHSEATLTCFFASLSVITDFKGHIVSNVSAKSED